MWQSTLEPETVHTQLRENGAWETRMRKLTDFIMTNAHIGDRAWKNTLLQIESWLTYTRPVAMNKCMNHAIILIRYLNSVLCCNGQSHQ